MDVDLERRMGLARTITSVVLSLRNKSGINVRQPLPQVRPGRNRVRHDDFVQIGFRQPFDGLPGKLLQTQPKRGAPEASTGDEMRRQDGRDSNTELRA